MSKLSGNVYRINQSVGALRVKLTGRNATPNTTITYRAAYASTAPTTTGNDINMNTYGTQLWQQTVGYTGNLTGDASVHAVLPADTYFWIAATAQSWTDFLTPTIEVDAATVPSTLASTVTGLTNGTTYEVQVLATNAQGRGVLVAVGHAEGWPARPAGRAHNRLRQPADDRELASERRATARTSPITTSATPPTAARRGRP